VITEKKILYETEHQIKSTAAHRNLDSIDGESSGMLGRLVSYKFTAVSEARAASFFLGRRASQVAYSSTLKMGAVYSSETSVDFYHIT
jgi:hypothetical protein